MFDYSFIIISEIIEKKVLLGSFRCNQAMENRLSTVSFVRYLFLLTLFHIFYTLYETY